MATGTGQVTLRVLQEIVGEDHAREAAERDDVDGVRPAFVVAPQTVDQVAELMRLAGSARLAVVPRGAGTKLSWGNPPQRVALLLDMSRMDRVLEHASGDLIAIIEAGAPLALVNDTVGQAGQMLAVDSPESAATVGGIVAANASGPRRHRYGTMRDLLIGITVVLPDGTIAKSGGKVVKNVAGYDLGKLFTGSLGTLGVIVQTIVRLHALPAASRLVVIDLTEPVALGDLLLGLKDSTLVPSALELVWEEGHGRVAILFEGVPPGVADQSARAQQIASQFGEARVVHDGDQARLWSELVARPWAEGDLGVKITALPTAVPRLLAEIDSLSSTGVRARVRGQLAPAVLYAALSGDRRAMLDALAVIRGEARKFDGSLVVLQASPELKRSVDVWGPPGDALPLMRRVKEQFDPQGIMSPGRFLGGI